MSNQESMFADQEPTGEQQVYQPINGSSYGQSGEQIPGQIPLYSKYNQGYTEQDARNASWQGSLQDEYTEPYVPSEAQRWNDGKIRPRQQLAGTRNMHWVWVPVIVSLLVFALISGAVFKNAHSWPASLPAHRLIQPAVQNGSQSTQIFHVDASPLLKITVGAANVHILASDSSTVVSVTTDGPDGGQVGSIQDSNTIDVDEPSGTTVDITTPVNSNIELEAVAGQININGINGQVNVNMQIGQVNLSQTTLSGQSRIYAGHGAVSFDGSLDPNGSYIMATNVGPVDVTLPPDASFSLIAGTDNIANDFGSDSVGNAPQPSLTLHSGTGNVSLHEAS